MQRTCRFSSQAALLALLLASASAWGFGYGDVVALAGRRAQTPYQQPAPVPDFLARLDYSQYRAITFKPDHALWPRRSFQVQFFSPGYLYRETVRVNVVVDGAVRAIPFVPEHFAYGPEVPAERIPPDLGFAGFRLHYDPPERALVGGPHPTSEDAAPAPAVGAQALASGEFLVFQGASYFRGRPLALNYGLSARGVAIGTGMNHPEEFPRFTQFWLVRPAPRANTMTVFALLDGPSIAGAYRFRIRPGKDAVVMDVEATLFLRGKVAKLGLAPLTSMYFYGIGDHRAPEFLRPAIHDSDGLLIHDAAGQWLWRALRGQGEVTITRFPMPTPRGFGLLQRERDFDNYQSLHASYQDRPSLWITPRGDWGRGHVELVEIPTADEYHDNIVAFWVPAQPPEPGKPLDYRYRMRWNASGPDHPLGKVTATRNALGPAEGTREIIAEFAARESPLTHEDIQADIQVLGGKLLHTRLRRDRVYRVWRLTLRVQPEPGQRLRVRARLLHEGEALTETWTYAIQDTRSSGP